ncbi:hypothetical protein TSUD_293500 [Trifolium subterraneum]|uniref:Uncharacterized protein n=1 Tax=Trifolium subterraneum TaxID=3900 RepID=A0A2Z6MB38_TRISU|nr:hypothetical protein TSUD_293500 [Trifolium subterraneum]
MPSIWADIVDGFQMLPLESRLVGTTSRISLKGLPICGWQKPLQLTNRFLNSIFLEIYVL